jgi:hypothetical protein
MRTVIETQSNRRAAPVRINCRTHSMTSQHHCKNCARSTRYMVQTCAGQRAKCIRKQQALATTDASLPNCGAPQPNETCKSRDRYHYCRIHVPPTYLRTLSDGTVQISHMVMINNGLGSLPPGTPGAGEEPEAAPSFAATGAASSSSESQPDACDWRTLLRKRLPI